MDEFDDLREYDGNQQHDMWVDYDYNVNTGEVHDYFDEDDDVDYDSETSDY